jgi:3-hydroxyacyl-[acyl-carrier-protein] dehydratase
MVDRVIDVVAGKSIVALKNVTANEAHFMGHFPGYPVMPGVLVLEALAQAGGLLAWETAGDPESISLLYLVGIENARFKQIVRPGDQLILKVELDKRKRNLWRYTAHAEVEGRLVAETDILMADGPKP